MDSETARTIARRRHAGQRSSRGGPRIEHIERVAAAVPEEARALAFLHEILEHTDIHGDELLAHGLTAREAAALTLLSRSPGESYELYVRRMLRADGQAGRLARTVLLADLDDNLREESRSTGEPPFAWAHRLVSARSRRELAPSLPAPA
jgi:hypothetical protein